jgi:phospholipid/cholesterol/gamma-HCH transport system ATP-binding protein
MTGVDVSSLHRPGLRVIKGIDWQVNAGDYWVIAGLQGSGKTDLLTTTAGLMPHVNGTYLLFGEPMPIFDEARMLTRMRLGLVFDGGQLFNHLTVRDNISLPLWYHRNSSSLQVADEVDRLLETLELGPFADSRPGALGRNWQQRVGLARALSLRPELLLVDGPLGGLDLRHTNWWLEFLDALARGHDLLGGRPLTLVTTAADLKPWQAHARQFAVLRDQRLAVLGTWSQLEAARGQLLDDLIGEQIAPGENI